MAATRNLGAWIVFLVSLLVLSLAATPYWRAADQLLIAIRLSIIALISVLFVRARLRRDDSSGSTARADRGDSLLLRLRRWYHGD